MKMQEWPESERPREKLIQFGAHTLSDTELLSIIINTGVKGKSALVLSAQALNQFGNLHDLLCASQKQFSELQGFGQAKFALIQSCRELCKRSMLESIKSSTSFTCAESAASYLKAHLSDKKREVFSMLLLDSQHQLIAYREMFRGTINSAVVYPRELVKQAMEDNAAAVILAHNHPSGLAEPSQADIQITRRIKEAFELIDVTVLDHFVIGRTSSVSFAQRGLL